MPHELSKLKASTVQESSQKVAKANQNSLIGSILKLTKSSHEPVFIYDQKENFLGLVSPYTALYQSRLPRTTKAGSAIFVPPMLKTSTSLLNIVNQMLSTRFYTLPIFSTKKQVIGLVRANKIFEKLLDIPSLLSQTARKLEIKQPITIHQRALVKEAYGKLRQKAVSRLIVVDDKHQLVGILTRNDLKQAFFIPASRQRFSKKFGETGQAMFDENDLKFGDLSIENLYEPEVKRLDAIANPEQVISELIKSGQNSLVLVNANNHPVGFVSNRNVLQAISQLAPKWVFPIVMEKPKFVSVATLETAYKLINQMGYKISRILPLQRFEISFKEGKVGIGKPTLIEMTLGAKFYSGQDFIAKTKQWQVLAGIKKALNQILTLATKTASKKKAYR